MHRINLGVIGQIALWLAIIGAINWGLTAMGFNLVEVITGRADWLATLIYALVGIAGLVLAICAAMGDRGVTHGRVAT